MQLWRSEHEPVVVVALAVFCFDCVPKSIYNESGTGTDSETDTEAGTETGTTDTTGESEGVGDSDINPPCDQRMTQEECDLETLNDSGDRGCRWFAEIWKYDGMACSSTAPRCIPVFNVGPGCQLGDPCDPDAPAKKSRNYTRETIDALEVIRSTVDCGVEPEPVQEWAICPLSGGGEACMCPCS